MAKAKTYGIISIKGGVGKTTTVCNLGAVLANDFNKKVLLVDANFSAPNLGLHIGIVNPENTIDRVLQDKAAIEDAIYEHEFGFHVILCNLLATKLDPFKLKGKLKAIRDYYDVILIDSSPNLNNEILATMIAADELVIVTTPDYPTLSTTMNAVKVAKQKKTPIAGIILNKIKNKSYELSLEEIEEAAGVPVICLMPHDFKFDEALFMTTPYALNSPGREGSFEYRKLAAFLVNEEYNDPRVSYRLKRFFKRDLPKHEVNRLLYGKQE